MNHKTMLLGALLVSACVADRSGEAGDVRDQPTQPLAIDTCPGRPTDPYTLGGLTIVGDVLDVAVATGGGCAQHSFSVCWNGAVADSFPPQASLELAYDAHGDTCDALIMQHVQLDLTSVPGLPRPVVLRVTGSYSRLADANDSIRYD